jgi:hypothetical protein
MIQLLIAINLALSCALCWLMYKAMKLYDHMTVIYHDLSLQNSRYILQALKENNHKKES